MTVLEQNTMYAIQDMAKSMHSINTTLAELLAIMRGDAERKWKEEQKQNTRESMKDEARRLADTVSAVRHRATTLLTH